jgi:hypothetical protein
MVGSFPGQKDPSASSGNRSYAIIVVSQPEDEYRKRSYDLLLYDQDHTESQFAFWNVSLSSNNAFCLVSAAPPFFELTLTPLR